MPNENILINANARKLSTSLWIKYPQSDRWKPNQFTIYNEKLFACYLGQVVFFYAWKPFKSTEVRYLLWPNVDGVVSWVIFRYLSIQLFPAWTSLVRDEFSFTANSSLCKHMHFCVIETFSIWTSIQIDLNDFHQIEAI